MNAGMFGVADGRGLASRKVIGRAAPAARTAVSAAAGVICTALGIATPSNTALSAGVRTRMLSVNGRGALRWASLTIISASSAVSFELWMDGKKVDEATVASSAAQTSFVLCGALGTPTEVSPVLDWMPFDSSVELYATSSPGNNAALVYLIDIHE